MQSAIHSLPDELLDHILSHINPIDDVASLYSLAICSRSLHRIATPWLYRSIVLLGEQLPLLLRSLLYNPHLCRLTHKLTLCMPSLNNPPVHCSVPWYCLLRANIKEIVSDDVWRPPPQGWSSDIHREQAILDDPDAWSLQISGMNDWNAQSALLLALMPRATHLKFRTYSSNFPLCSGQVNYLRFSIIAAANTQRRALAANGAPHAEGVLPRLRSVCMSGEISRPSVRSSMPLKELLSLALPPLVEELRFSGIRFRYHRWDRKWPACAAQIKFAARVMAFDNCTVETREFREFLSSFPKLERLDGLPEVKNLHLIPDPNLQTVLKSTASTLRELDLPEDAHGGLGFTSFSSFSVLEKLGMSVGRLDHCWKMKGKNNKGPKRLYGKFPPSLRELSIMSLQSPKEAFGMEVMLAALVEVLRTPQLPALKKITLWYVERELTVDLSRQCEAREIRLVLHLWGNR